MIISGGYNIYPARYRRGFLRTSQGNGSHRHRDSPSQTRREAVKVFVVLKERETATQEEMIAFCEGKLAKYKWPTEIEFRDELPKTNVGKVLKKDLRAEELAKRK
jgi:long-chain acyl-CoA synthetase